MIPGLAKLLLATPGRVRRKIETRQWFGDGSARNGNSQAPPLFWWSGRPDEAAARTKANRIANEQESTEVVARGLDFFEAMTLDEIVDLRVHAVEKLDEFRRRHLARAGSEAGHTGK
jgi:hypothetical protein